MNKLTQIVDNFKTERIRVRALNSAIEFLTDPGLIDRILAGESGVIAPAPPAPKPEPAPRPVRSIDGILRFAV